MLVLVLVAIALFSACDRSAAIADGVYRVEMDEFDANGYKDFVEFDIQGGKIVSITANAYAEDGTLKTDSIDFKNAMESITGTYPEKFYRDLVNEYIGSEGESTDVIAGATISSNHFFSLMEMAKEALLTGDTGSHIISNE